jgi:hypothetical protein
MAVAVARKERDPLAVDLPDGEWCGGLAIRRLDVDFLDVVEQ